MNSNTRSLLGSNPAPAISPARVIHNRWLTVAICIFLAAIIWIVFGQAMRHGFVNFDDDVYVYKNGMVSQGLTSTSVAWAFTQMHSSNWHPLTWLSHMLDCQWYGLNPSGHHLTNIVLHTATAILLFLLLLQMFRFNATPPLLHKNREGEGAVACWHATVPSPRNAGAGRGLGRGALRKNETRHPLSPALSSTKTVEEREQARLRATAFPSPRVGGVGKAAAIWCSAFIAAVFAIHPLRVESVAWIAERKDVLSGLFFVLTLMAYTSYATHKTYKAYLLTLVFFAFGLMSKPMLVTLPFVLLLLDYWPLQRVSRLRCASARQAGEGGGLAAPKRSGGGLVVEKIPLFILSGAMCLLTLRAQKEALSYLPLSIRASNALVSYVVYLKQLFYPAGLAVFYPYPETGVAPDKLNGAVLLLLAISVLAILARRRYPWLLVGWLWYLGMLVPAIGILQVGSQAQADRYTYLPQIGLGLALAWTAANWCAGVRLRRVALGIFSALIVVALIFCAHRQTAYWRNSESLWTHTLGCTADSLTARINLGNALLDEGRVDEAIAHYQKALQLRPDDPEANVSFGYGLVQKGKPDDAAGYFQRALALKPDHAAAHNDLGNLLAQKGKATEAIVHFQKALQVKPDYAEAAYNLGNAFFEQGDLSAAIASYRKALQIKPDYIEACFNLGNALFQKGDVDEAIERYHNALQLRPDYLKARYNLGMIAIQQRHADEAIDCFQKILQLNPNHAEAHFNLAHALLQKGLSDQAIAQLQQAVRVKSDYTEAQNDLAWELATDSQASLRNGREAVELAEHANQSVGGTDLDILDTLAAAYAEAGRFEDAVRSVRKAIALAEAAGQKDQLTQLNQELKLYESGLPFHQNSK